MAVCCHSSFTKAVLLSILGAPVDAFLSILLLIHGTNFSRFSEHLQVQEFKFCSSVFDLWVLSILHSCSLFGAVFRLQCAKRKKTQLQGLFSKETLTVLQYSMHCLRCSKISAEHRMYYGQDCQNLVWVFYCTLKTYGLRYLLSGIKVVNLTTEQENQSMLIIGLCHGKQ